VTIALAFGVLQHGVGGETIDDQPAIEVRAEDGFGDFMAATLANGIDGHVLVTEHPEPGIQPTDAPAGLVGMHDLGPAQGLDEEVVSGKRQVGQTLLGANQSGRAEGEITISAEEVTDFAIGNAETMFEFRRHREGDGAECVPGRTNGVGDLLRMATLTVAPTTGTIPRLDVELRDDRNDRRQIGLILDDHAGFEEVGLTIGTAQTRDVNDAINPFGRRRGAIGRGVTFATAGFLGVGLDVPATEGSRLPMRFAPGHIELLAETVVLGFQLGEAALQLGNVALQASNGAVAFATAGTSRDYHDNPPLSVPKERDGSEVRCRGALA
jgi:hypothetical protein